MLACAGTTLHSQAGCGVPRIYKDFGRMWNKLPLARWRSLKVRCRSGSLTPCWSNRPCAARVAGVVGAMQGW